MMRPDRGLGSVTARFAALVAGLSLATIVASVAASAQEPTRPDSTPPDSAVFTLAEIEVRPVRPLATVAGAAAISLSLQAPRLIPVAILADALREMPFVQVRQNSRGEQQLTLRGTESRQVAVLVDGIPLTLGWDARTDLSLLPVMSASQLQLFRGLSSILHGPNVLGGVVEVDITRGPNAPERVPLLQAEGGFDQVGAAVLGGELGQKLTWGDRSLALRVGGGYRQRDGFPLPGSVDPARPTSEDLRLNSDFQHANGFVSARYGVEDGLWVSLTSLGFNADRGVPPELHLEEPRLWRIPDTSRWVTAISAGTGWGSTPLGEGDLEASVGLDFGAQTIESYETLAYETVVGVEVSDDRTLTARLLGDHSLGRGTLRGAFTLAETRHLERIDAEPESRFRQRLWSLAAELEHPIGSDGASDAALSNFTITAGASLDRASTPETGPQPAREPIVDWGARVGAAALVGGGVGRLHAGVSRRVRFPSLRELYSGALGRFVPNAELQPEVLAIAETGITGRTGIVEGQAVLFYQRLTDAIVRTSAPDGRFMRENRRAVTTGGIELLANLQLGRAVFAGDVTLQGVSQRDEEAPELERRPEYQPEVFGSVELRGPLFLEVWGRAGVRYVGTQYCVNPELEADQSIDPSGRLDLLLTRDFALGGAFTRIQATLALDNVTDSVVFDQCGLPQPGRMLRLQFRLG